MKKYPKPLADAAVMNDVLDFLYRQAEAAENNAEDYKEKMEESDETCSWYEESYVENAAKAEAYVRLAEKLAK